MKESNALGASHGMELPFMLNNVSLQREMTGDTVKYTAGMVAKMRLIGFNFNLVGSVEIGGQEIETREIGVDHIMLDYAPLTTGNAPVQLMNGETIATLSVTRESGGGDAPLDEG